MEVTRVESLQNHAPQAPSAVQLTPRAVAMVKDEMAKAKLGENWALRIAVVGGGCSGFQYDMDFSDERREDDQASVQEGLTVLVDERSAHYLSGTTVDYVDTFGAAGFKFSNPNAKKTCGCGTSFSADGGCEG